MAFNATFNNISVIGGQFYWRTEYMHKYIYKMYMYIFARFSIKMCQHNSINNNKKHSNNRAERHDYFLQTE